MERSLSTPFGVLSYEYTVKSVKRMNLRLRPDGSVHLSVPYGTPTARAEAFLLANAHKLLSAQQRIKNVKSKPILLPTEVTLQEGCTLYFRGNPYRLHVVQGLNSLLFSEDGTAVLSLASPQDPKRRLEAWKVEIKHFLQPLLEQCCQSYLPWFLAHGAQAPQALRLRSMKGMWGNCRPQSGILTFSLAVAALPPHLCDAIVCHELTHLLVPDHSARFYGLLYQICPDYRQCKEEMRRFGESLR